MLVHNAGWASSVTFLFAFFFRNIAYFTYQKRNDILILDFPNFKIPQRIFQQMIIIEVLGHKNLKFFFFD